MLQSNQYTTQRWFKFHQLCSIIQQVSLPAKDHQPSSVHLNLDPHLINPSSDNLLPAQQPSGAAMALLSPSATIYSVPTMKQVSEEVGFNLRFDKNEGESKAELVL